MSTALTLAIVPEPAIEICGAGVLAMASLKVAVMVTVWPLL